jgi:hypothetical protein
VSVRQSRTLGVSGFEGEPTAASDTDLAGV